jgi:hypothetical protein
VNKFKFKVIKTISIENNLCHISAPTNKLKQFSSFFFYLDIYCLSFIFIYLYSLLLYFIYILEKFLLTIFYLYRDIFNVVCAHHCVCSNYHYVEENYYYFTMKKLFFYHYKTYIFTFIKLV